MLQSTHQELTISDFHRALALQKQCKDIQFRTTCLRSRRLSEQYGCNVFLKREDELPVRIYKLRGIYNKMMNISEEQKKKGVVCSSDGNLAQCVAYLCNHFKVKGVLYLPEVCFQWKIDLIRKFGKDWVKLVINGDNYETAEIGALQYAKDNGSLVIHSYDDIDVVSGNGAIAIEIIEDMPCGVDYLFVPIGRGSLAAAMGFYFNAISPKTKVVGVEPTEAAAMTEAFKEDKICKLSQISRFCDGSSVAWASNIGFKYCKLYLDQLLTVPDGKVSTTILQLYEQGIPVEPAGALSVSCLEQVRDEIKGKNVVCIISGATVDLSRFDEFKEFSLLHEGLKFFLLINLPFKTGIIRDFVSNCLGQDDEVTSMQFQARANRETGPLLAGIQVPKKENIELIKKKMEEMQLNYKILDQTMDIYDLLV